MDMLVTFASKARGTVTYAEGIATGCLYQWHMLNKTVAFHYSWRCELFMLQALHRLSDRNGRNAAGACLCCGSRELPLEKIISGTLHLYEAERERRCRIYKENRCLTL